MCDVRVAAHTQNCPKNGPLKARLMAWAAKLRQKISQPASAKQYISPFISLYFKPLFLVLISVLSKLSKESLRQGGLRCCSLENIYLLFYLRWRKVGTEYSQETAASDSEDDSCQCNNCYSISVRLFTFTGVLLPHQFSLDHPSSWHGLWDFKSRIREQPVLERSRAVWGLDSVSQTKFPLIRSTHVVANFIYFAESDRPNLRWRLTRWKTILKHEVGVLRTENFAWLCIRSRPA